LSQHLPRLEARIDVIERHGHPHDDGAGIRMGAAVGGAAVRMCEMFITTPWYPPSSLTRGIAVNAQGQRFINEDCYHGRVAGAIFAQTDGIAYLIADEACFGRPAFGVELAAVEESIEALERALKLPRDSLCHTLASYNAEAARGKDPSFHKRSDWLTPLTKPPFAALDISVGRSTYYAFTLGGLRARPSGEVETSEGHVIEGLYAAGANAAGIPRSAGTYCSGQSVGDATFFGRRAGAAAADSAAP
jgi:3-oxo-5alpha-steroid 4-dehydrogenase